MSTNRLEAFSDGFSAIAITLLVLDIHVPEPGSGHDAAPAVYYALPVASRGAGGQSDASIA